MRRDAVVLRTPITLTAAGLAAVVALTACGSVQMGAAATLSTKRISASTLTAEVNNLNAAYMAANGKIQLQFAKSEMPQEVLSWLLRFRVQEQLAAQQGITVTGAESQNALASAAGQARQSGSTLPDLAVANGLPPNQLPELGRYQAIETQFVKRLNGGKLPTSSTSPAVLQTLGAQYGKAQCLAAKSLAIKVNPQFGRLDYTQISVVPDANVLSAPEGSPSPKPTGTSAPELSPAC